MTLSGKRVKSIVDASGQSVPALILEPELLGSVFSAELEDRTVIRLADAPASLVDAVLVTEDRDFYRHSGVSVRRLFGALFATVTGGMKQGGSTLTQQLVKNLYLSPERTLRRKANEAVMAVVLDARYSKDEILETYLNEIYLGRRGSIGITGVGEAARYYFGKEVADLDLAESATLAGMIRAPNAYSPFRNPERTRERRNLILRLMKEEGKIDEAAMRQAMEQPVTARSRSEERTKAPHFVDFVKGELAERYGEQLQTEGLQIYTTLDVDLQQAAQRAVTQGLDTLEKTYRRLASASREAPLQGALIAARAADRQRAGPRRRARLPPLAVQPRDAGAPPAGQSLQAVRVPRGVRAPRPRPAGHSGHGARGLADRRRVGQPRPTRNSGRRATTTTTTAAG